MHGYNDLPGIGIYVMLGRMVVGDVLAAPNGTADVTFTLPATITAGTYVVTARGITMTTKLATASFQLLPSSSPAMRVQPCPGVASIGPGGCVQMDVIGFPNDDEEEWDLVWPHNSQTVTLGTATTDDLGRATLFATVPATARVGGGYAIVALPAGQTGPKVTKSVTLTEPLKITLSQPDVNLAAPMFGTMPLMVQAAGLQPGEPVTLTAFGQTYAGTASATGDLGAGSPSRPPGAGRRARTPSHCGAAGAARPPRPALPASHSRPR